MTLVTFSLQVLRSSLKPCVTFHNKLAFYSEELLAPYPMCKLEDHPLSGVCDCLFNIFAATFHIRGCLHSHLKDVSHIMTLNIRVTESRKSAVCSIHRRDEKCIQNFSQKAWMGLLKRSKCRWEDNIKMDLETVWGYGYLQLVTRIVCVTI